MYREPESHAVYLLKKQSVTRLDILDFISHGVSKIAGETAGVFHMGPGDEDEDEATVRLWANRRQMDTFAKDALKACAAGRPICPLCSRAIDPDGHECPRVNGHAKITSLE